MQQWTAEPLFNLGMSLGEGPQWHAPTQQLYWVDINQQRLYRYHPASGQRQHYDLDRTTTAVGATAGHRLLIAQAGRLAWLDPLTGQVEGWVPLEADQPTQRPNDGKVGPDGCYYLGTMAYDAAPRCGTLYRIDQEGRAKPLLTQLTIANGMAWTADYTTFYFTDSPTRQIRAYDFDPTTGQLANERVVITTPAGRGVPDGFTIDEQGLLWVAHYGGSGVYCYDPSTGDTLAYVSVAAPNVTSCVFGGPQLDTLYITTASQDMQEEEKIHYPLAGALFCAKVGSRGRLPHVFAVEDFDPG